MDLSVIQSKIYYIRGFNVILDFDLAERYQAKTKALNQAVKRNIKRFPPDFMFQLTKEEFISLRSQIVTSNRGGTRYLPFAFTEHGVTMSANVLNSDVAIEASILIVRAFVALRQLLITSPINEIRKLQNEMHNLKGYLEDVFADYNDINENTRMELELINQMLAELHSKNKWLEKPRNPIGFIVPK